MMPPRPAALSEGYQMLGRLGGGAFGDVYKARAPGGFPVAVKVIHCHLDDAEAQRELKSLEAIKELRHPYLLPMHACWAVAGRLHIAMELGDGTLRGRLKECLAQGKTGLPVEELFRYFWEAAEAIDFLHRHKVLHRDIKPDNLLLLAGHVKVADFGLARVQGGQTVGGGTVCGTAQYMPPELWDGQCSERSDQYSLAASYVELRLGRLPFRGATVVELMKQHQEGAPDLGGLPEAERMVLARALASDRVQRYGSCVEFLKALRAALVGQIQSQPPPPGSRAAAPGLSVFTLMVLALAAGLVALAVYFAYTYWEHKQEGADPISTPPPGQVD